MLRMISLLGCLMLTISLGVPSAFAIGKVLSLDGAGDYVEAPHIDFTGVFTVEAWIFALDLTVIGDEGVLYQVEHGGTPDKELRLVIRRKHPFIGFHSNDLISPTELKNYVWYHVAYQYTGSEQRIYLNGELDAFRATSPYEGIVGNTIIGVWFKGFIDEVRVWSVARTQEEIQDNMNQPIENPASRSNLVGYWNFDDGTADDLSQYENHGDLYGGAHIADVIYVSPDGSPTGDGTQENPYDTIQRGINESGRKDIVQVLPGVYEENIELVSDLIILGSGSENTTITAASGNIVTANNVHNVSLSEFTIDGQGSADYGILCNGTTSEMEIRDNVITGASKVGIACSDSVHVDIKNNTIEKNGRDGILCDGSARVVINNNIISQNSEDGVECGGSTNVTIYDNNVGDNERHGVACNGDATVSIVNNDIRRNTWRGLSCGSAANVTIQYNVISENNWAAFCTDSSIVNITDNLIYSNQGPEIVLAGSSNIKIIRNIIRNPNIIIGCHEIANVLIGGNLTDANNIAANRGAAIRNWGSTIINATYNYWGTTDESEISAMMRNKGEGSIVFKPYINTLDEIIADVSGDGTISALDAALILQYVIGLIDKFPATNPISQAGQKYISGEISIDELDRMLQKWGYPSVFKLLGLENQLLQNYPNPFNPDTWIPFKLAQSVPVTINIYDVKGQLIRTLHIGNKGAGVYVTKEKAAYWDGMDSLGEKVSSGVFFYTLRAGDFRATRKMLIVK